MANKIINTDFITAIANAIRQKLGTSDPISIANMPSSIESIPSGGESKLPGVIDGSATTLTASDFGNATKIRIYAFYKCASLTNVVTSSITSLEELAFNYCTNLLSITINGTLTNISKSAFRNCTNLKTVNLPDTITTLSDYSFNTSGIETLPNMNNVKTIGLYVFQNCDSLKSIVIPDTVTSIGQYAFGSCGALESVDTGYKITSLASSMCTLCNSLKEIIIRPQVNTISGSCFYINTSRHLEQDVVIKVYRETPPTTYSSSIPENSIVLNVYVPASAIATYEATSGWSAYKGKYLALPDWNEEYAEMEKNSITDSKDVEEPIEEIINEEDE